MSSPDASGSSTARSKRRREPETLEEAWRLHCKHSVAGSRRSVWKYVAWPEAMPDTLKDYAPGGIYYTVDPPPRPMSGRKFEKWLAERELLQSCKRGDDGASGSGGGRAAAEEEALPATEEEEEAAFAAALELSKQEAEARARAEAEEEAKAVADVEAFKEMEAKAGPVVFLD